MFFFFLFLILQTVKRLFTLANLGPEQWIDLTSLREIMGVMQHHDAITGTEKEAVAYDYAFRLHRALGEAHTTVERALKYAPIIFIYIIVAFFFLSLFFRILIFWRQ